MKTLTTANYPIPLNCILLPILSGLFVILCASGCKTYRYAGAPSPSFDVDEDIKQLSDQFKPAVVVSNFYALGGAATTSDRNKVISGRLVMINLEYLKWLRTVTADKQLLDTASDVLILSLNLAATATEGAAVKTVLSAISAGIVGSKTAVDKHYYYEKTLPALVTAMNAQRKTVLTNILSGMTQPLGAYMFEQALTDLQAYYQAGTFMGAVSAVQADATAKEKIADKEIAVIQIKIATVRNAEFVTVAVQKRVGVLLDKIDQLKKEVAIGLAQNPPVSDSEMDKIVALRDPNAKHLTDETAAKQIIKLRISLGGTRSDKELAAWEAAVKSVQ